MRASTLLACAFTLSSLPFVLAAHAADGPTAKPTPTVAPLAPPVVTVPPVPPPPAPAPSLQFPPISAKLKTLAALGHPKITTPDLDAPYFLDAGHPVGPGGALLLGTRWPESSDPTSMRILMSPGRVQRVNLPDGARWLPVAPRTAVFIRATPSPSRNYLVDCVFENESSHVPYRVKKTVGLPASTSQQTSTHDVPFGGGPSAAGGGSYGTPLHVTEVVRGGSATELRLEVATMNDDPAGLNGLRVSLAACEITPFVAR